MIQNPLSFFNPQESQQWIQEDKKLVKMADNVEYDVEGMLNKKFASSVLCLGPGVMCAVKAESATRCGGPAFFDDWK